TIAGAATASKTSLQGNGPASYNVLMKSRISDSKTRRHAARIAPSVGHGVHPWCALGPSRCLQHLGGPPFRIPRNHATVNTGYPEKTGTPQDDRAGGRHYGTSS